MKTRPQFTALFILAFTIIPTIADTIGPFNYRSTQDGIEILSCSQEVTGEVVVPATIEGQPVTSILGTGWLSGGGFDWWVGAFWGCSQIKTIVLPASVTSIGSGAFEDCSRLESIVVAAENPNYSSEDGVLFDREKTTLFDFPEGKRGAYRIPDSVTTILGEINGKHGGSGVGAFSGCSHLRSVTFASPGTVVIGSGTFDRCKNLKATIILSTTLQAHSWCYCDPYDESKIFLETHPAFTLHLLNGSPNPWEEIHPSFRLDGPPSPMETWLFGHSLQMDTILDQDLNGDGVSLLMAYALNLDPNLNLQGSLPSPVLEGNKLTLTFHAASPGITYTVETSTDLQNWVTDGVVLSELTTANQRSASITLNSPRRFLRLVVSETP